MLAAVVTLTTVAAQQQDSRHSRRTAEPQPQYQRNEPIPPIPPVATPEQVSLIARHLKKQNFDGDRLEVAILCVKLIGIPVEGLRLIAREFSFDDNRLKFLKEAYQFCPDRDRYWMLEECFTFQSNGDELKRYVRSKY